MKKFAKIENEETKVCSVGIGTDTEFYRSIGMSEMEVEQAYDGSWYLKGYAPEKPVEQKQAEVRSKRDRMIGDFDWRISRNNDERELGLTETDNRELLLKYREYLRNYPETEGWYEHNPMTFEEWKQESITATEGIKEDTIAEEGGE